MSPSSDPVVCRATSGAQSPSAGGRIAPHQRTTQANTSAKIDSAAQRTCVKSAITVQTARMTNTTEPAALAHSGAGNRNHNASAAHSVSGAISRTETQTQRVAEAIRLISTFPGGIAYFSLAVRG